jgi:hypothetical protein
MKASSDNARQWLAHNNYDDVLGLINKVMDGWKMKGTQTRRNWWEVLAGDSKGSPRTIEGVKFPVLRAARLRMKLDVTKDCLCRNKKETVPQ